MSSVEKTLVLVNVNAIEEPKGGSVGVGGGGGDRRSSGSGIYSGTGYQSDDEEDQQRCNSSPSSSQSGTAEIKERRSSSVSEVDLECGGVVTESKVHLSRVERDCRICHMSLDAGNQESGFPIDLGCSCKDDLAAAHKHCAEAWFKIKGNKTCEICGSVARNVAGANEAELMEQWNEANDAAAATSSAPVHGSETRNFWQGHRFLNFLLACMVFAFVISWLFHFNVPS